VSAFGVGGRKCFALTASKLLVIANAAERRVESGRRERDRCEKRELLPEQSQLVVADVAVDAGRVQVGGSSRGAPAELPACSAPPFARR
jgi:hypothetical protein